MIWRRALLLLASAGSTTGALLRASRNAPAQANLTVQVQELHQSLTNFFEHKDGTAETDEHAFGQKFMSSAQQLLSEVASGKKTAEKAHLAQDLITDLQKWAAHTSQRVVEQKHKLQEDDANFLLKLLVERQKLPMATQLAVLRRQDVAQIPWAKRLLANHTNSPCLAEQLRAILAVEAKDVKVTVGHKIAIDHSKQGDKLREVQKKMKTLEKQMGGIVNDLDKAYSSDPKFKADVEAQKVLADAKAAVARMDAGEGTKQQLKDLKVVGDDVKVLNARQKVHEEVSQAGSKLDELQGKVGSVLDKIDGTFTSDPILAGDDEAQKVLKDAKAGMARMKNGEPVDKKLEDLKTVQHDLNQLGQIAKADLQAAQGGSQDDLQHDDLDNTQEALDELKQVDDLEKAMKTLKK